MEFSPSVGLKIFPSYKEKKHEIPTLILENFLPRARHSLRPASDIQETLEWSTINQMSLTTDVKAKEGILSL